jgi:hypothetical protein
MKRVMTFVATAAVFALQLSVSAPSASAAKRCGSVPAFGQTFRITAKGPTCKLARATATKYSRVSRAKGCGSYMGSGPCRVNGYECATSGYNRFSCFKGRRSIVARIAG